MRYVSRWVDDFIKVSKDKQEAEKVRRLVIFLHTRYGVKLAKDKLEGPQRRADFGGGDFIAKGTWLSIPKEKRIKYARDLERVVAGEMMDVKFMDTVVGRLQWCTRFFPKGKPFVKGMRAFKEVMEKATRRAEKGSNGGKQGLLRLQPSGAARRDAEFWLQVMRSAPATFAPLHHQRVEEAQVHAHMDWGLGGIRGREGERLETRRNFVGVYVLSTGEYTVAEVPKEWMASL